jgi:hypothetical protein
MKLTQGEIDFLSAWAREEGETDCYHRPAHRLLLARAIPGGQLIALIKAWTKAEAKKDMDLLLASTTTAPPWPWPGPNQLESRRREAEALLTPGAA